MPNPVPDNVARVSSRATTLLLVGVIGVSAVGFVVGIRAGVPRGDEGGDLTAVPAPRGLPDTSSEVVPALTYAEMGRSRLGPNRAWKSTLADLVVPAGDETAAPNDLDARRASLALRAERRAYNGAPPVIPHAADQISSAECMTCHEAALRIGTRPADRMPHPYFANCQQCHVAAATPFAPTMLVANRFDGVPAPFEGPRAWTGAPPMVPHATFMRDDCLSCHGPSGKPGMRTTHPERQQCLQCHAPSAELNRSVLAVAPRFLSPLPVTDPEPTDAP